MFKTQPNTYINELIASTKEALDKANFSRVIIALSGGVDSALSTFLAVQALGKENVFVVCLPYGVLNPQSLLYARLVIEELSLSPKNSMTFNIEKAVNAIVDSVGKSTQVEKGNIMARVRMTYLYDQAKKHKALVYGTENKTEHYLGYFTRFGDEASDIEPIRNLYKTQVWEVAKYIGVPQPIIDANPTAGLWEGQTDEEELQFSYTEADQVLYLYFEKHESIENIIQKGISREVIERILERVRNNEFKNYLPILFK